MAGRDRWERDSFYEQDRYEDDRHYSRGPRGGGRGRAYDDDVVYDRSYEYERDRGDRRGDYDRQVVIEKDRERGDARPFERPGFRRRQSSLDTYDRRPMRGFYEREEYPPPARREDIRRDDFRAPPYVDIPLRRRPDDRYRDDLAYGDVPPERTYEREVIRSRDRREGREPSRSHSRDSHTTKASKVSKARTHRSESKASTATSSSSSSSSSSGGTTIANEYPKKGKTRVPVRLVSRRALIDLGYPYVEEGNVIIVQKALGQENIDQLLKLSEEYKRSEEEVAAARSSAGDVEEREVVKETFTIPPRSPAPAPAPAPPPVALAPPPRESGPTPVIIEAHPNRTAEVIEYDRTVYRDDSSDRSSVYDYHHHHHSDALVARSRSRSRSGREIRAEIKALERQLAHRPRGGEITEKYTERLPSGELIVYEEAVEKIKSPPKPPRIEKDKKGPPPQLMRAMLATLT